MMAEPSDSDVTLSDDELELLQGVGRGGGFEVVFGDEPFVFGVTSVTGQVRVKPQSELIKADQGVVQVRFLGSQPHCC